MITRQILAIAAISAACASAMAVDLPTRKPGVWEITINIGNPKIPPRVEKVCIDAATDQLLYKVGAGASQKMCGKVDVHTASGKVTVDSECQIGGTKATSHSVTTMMGDSAYHTDTNVHYEPAMFGKSDATSTQDAKWIAACPADMRAGDVVVQPSAMMPVPMKMNLNDMFKGGQ
jgi:hypothetical protein